MIRLLRVELRHNAMALLLPVVAAAVATALQFGAPATVMMLVKRASPGPPSATAVTLAVLPSLPPVFVMVHGAAMLLKSVGRNSACQWTFQRRCFK